MPSVRFRKLTDEHIRYFRELMKDDSRRNFTLSKKRKVMMDHFEGLQVSNSTIHRLVNFILESHKCLSSINYCDIVSKEYASIFRKKSEIKY